MILSRYTLKNLSSGTTELPDESLFDLPEKVLQFGTGVLLRGLPDYFIDKANRQGIFNGRIVVVKSTARGDTSAFDKQDGLYTICIKGNDRGRVKEENSINSSISRVLSASTEWGDILKCAHNPHMQIILSNTTEAGIELVNEDINRHPPVSFPAKLLSFLWERYKAFDGSPQSGMVIVPTELISNNGQKLQSIVLELAHLNGLDASFIDWLEECNYFCNSLVDRIVPGTPAPAAKQQIERDLGYRDDLLIAAESYALWAIEGNDHVKKVLCFAEADKRVVIQSDINVFRELKLRLLNGTHTLACGIAYLSGCSTVSEAMTRESVADFISSLMQNEIAPSIPYDVDPQAVKEFSAQLLERFSNPSIQHHWLSITVQYSAKIKQRVIPVLVRHYEHNAAAPELISLGFAAYLLFMRAVKKENEIFYGEYKGEAYAINDSRALYFFEKWNTLSPAGLVQDVLEDEAFWGADLSLLPGFAQAVCEKLEAMMNGGVNQLLEELQMKKVA